MGEIRLICPECGTEYRLPSDAVPVHGRNVECSACGHVWHQPGQSTVPAPESRPAQTPADAPKLHRPLPASVLSVLQEEAALARQQSDTAATTPTTTSKSQGGRAAQPDADDWPATTISDAAAVGAAGTLSLNANPAAGPAPSRHINPAPQRPAETPPAHERMEATVNRTTPHGTATPSRPAPEPAPIAADQPARTASSSAYARGLRWSVGIAAALLLVYLAAPRLADQGEAGARLMEWRVAVDDGRLWLQDQVFGSRSE